MSASPYEIRLDVLKLAKEILDSNVQGQPLRNSANIGAVDAATAMVSSSNMATVSMSSLEAATPYTADDVISTATRLYSFIKDNK